MRKPWTRREFLVGSAGVMSSVAFARGEPEHRQALVAITLDLEMARNFPRWEDTEWDYQKGNLDAPTKAYARAACDHVREQGGVLHSFVVGQVFEQADVSWLKEIAAAGHPIGNHTYDHVNLLASDLSSLQFRFQRSPWLGRGKAVPDLIRENIALTTEALRGRVGVEPSGFRTPGGFASGLSEREDLQKLLLEAGFSWASSKYPAHRGMEDLHGTGRSPSDEAVRSILEAQQQSQPFVYPTGLIEVPMSPPSDIVAFRGGRWQLTDFLDVLTNVLDHVIEEGLVFDFLAHPSCLGVVDPQLKAIRLICDKVKRAGASARLASLDELAGRARGTS